MQTVDDATWQAPKPPDTASPSEPPLPPMKLHAAEPGADSYGSPV